MIIIHNDISDFIMVCLNNRKQLRNNQRDMYFLSYHVLFPYKILFQRKACLLYKSEILRYVLLVNDNPNNHESVAFWLNSIFPAGHTILRCSNLRNRCHEFAFFHLHKWNRLLQKIPYYLDTVLGHYELFLHNVLFL